MKKVISGILVILIIFNFIFCNNYVRATQDGKKAKSPYLEQTTPSNTITAEIIENGTVSQTQDSATKTTLAIGSWGVSAVGTITGIISRIINIFIIQIDVLMSILSVTVEDGAKNEELNNFWFTIDRTVFNRVALFNVNYFDTNNTYNVGDIEIEANSSNIAVKEGISKVYQICRMLAIILSLLVLIYIGIRMAIAVGFSDRAKYKEMFFSWAISVVLIFIMPYLMSFIFKFGEVLISMFFELRKQLINSGDEIFEEIIRAQTWVGIFEKSGLDLTMWSIIYWVLLFMEIKFFMQYIKRFLVVGFLIIISPLITVTYSIDKVGDGKAQAFTVWLQEFTVNVLIQPLHALIYLMFVVSANSIAKASPIVALAMLLCMGTVEKMVKVLFKISAHSLKNFADFDIKKG